jgi:hypothetical protein
MSKNTGTSELINYFDLGANGDVGIAGSLDVNTIANATTDTDRFLVSDTGIIKYRTGAELLSDIGAQAAGNFVTTDTSQAITANKSFTVGFSLASEGSGNQTSFFRNTSSLFSGSGGTNIFGFNNSNNIYFGKGLNNGGVLQWNNTTATRYYTLPDADGTLALTSQIPANPVGGTGAFGRVAYWNGTGTITSDSLFQWNDTFKRLGIGRTPTVSLDVEGAGFFSTSVTSQVNNISADGAGVVLQGYVDNILRIAVRGSGYNSGARGGLLASTGDFSSSVTASGQITGPSGGTEGKFNFIGYNNAYGGITANTGFNTNYNAVSIYSNFNSTRNGQGNTSNPSWILDLGGSIPDPDSFSIFRSPAGSFTFSNLFKITSGGNVLIGTTTDNGVRFQLTGGINGPVMSITNSSSGGYSGAHVLNNSGSLMGHFGFANASTGATLQDVMYFGSIASKPVVFTTADTERMRITSDGTLTLTRASGTVNLTVFQTGGGDNFLDVSANAFRTNTHLPINDNTYPLGASTSRWSAVWAVNGTIQTSDEREKKDINNTDLGLDFINQLRPVSFKWKVGQNVETTETTIDKEGKEITKSTITPRAGIRTHYGLIAQEVEALLDGKDFGGFIHDEETDIKGLRYDQFIPLLIKAIQELNEKINK